VVLKLSLTASGKKQDVRKCLLDPISNDQEQIVELRYTFWAVCQLQPSVNQATNGGATIALTLAPTLKIPAARAHSRARL
jgi:hypothetical protein